MMREQIKRSLVTEIQHEILRKSSIRESNRKSSVDQATTSSSNKQSEVVEEKEFVSQVQVS